MVRSAGLARYSILFIRIACGIKQSNCLKHLLSSLYLRLSRRPAGALRQRFVRGFVPRVDSGVGGAIQAAMGHPGANESHRQDSVVPISVDVHSRGFGSSLSAGQEFEAGVEVSRR